MPERYLALRQITLGKRIVLQGEVLERHELDNLDHVSLGYLLNHGWVEVHREIQANSANGR